MTSRLRGLLGVLGIVLLAAGVSAYTLHAFGFWKKPPESENAKRYQYKQYQTIPNPQGSGTIEVEISPSVDREPNTVSLRQILTIVLPLGGIGIVLLMVYGFTAPAASSSSEARHQRSLCAVIPLAGGTGRTALKTHCEKYPVDTNECMMSDHTPMRLGILSDTHDELLRTRRAAALLRTAEALVHCGDLASGPIVRELAVLPSWFSVWMSAPQENRDRAAGHRTVSVEREVRGWEKTQA